MNTKNDNQPADSPEANSSAGAGCMAQIVRSSLTPETDNHEAERDAMQTRASSDYFSTLELCRKLERERDEANQEVIRIREFMNHGFTKAKIELEDTASTLAAIMRDEINAQEEAEKWLRAYAPHHLLETNAERTHGGGEA